MTELGKFGIALASNEIILSAAVTPMHRSLLASYRMNAHRGENAARDLIISDLRSYLDLGALDRATDLMIVLALFMRESARCAHPVIYATRRQRDAIAVQRSRGSRAHYIVGAKRTGEEAAPGLGRNLRVVQPERRLEDEGAFENC